jgi:hypothetical protein
MSMDIDEAGDHQSILGADRLARICLGQGRGELDDLAAGNRDIHRAAQAAAGVDHIPATDQQIVFHRFLRFLFVVRPGCPLEHRGRIGQKHQIAVPIEPTANAGLTLSTQNLITYHRIRRHVVWGLSG